jgi:hypothetical protein
MSESDIANSGWGKMRELEKGEGLHMREEAGILIVPKGRNAGSRIYHYKVSPRIERSPKTLANLILRSWLFYFC